MSYVLASLTVTPPGGWTYSDPLVPGLPVRAESYEELLERVVHLRHVNGQRTAGVEYEILRQIVGRLTTAQRAAFAVPEVRLSRSYRHRLRALRALIHPDYVSRERAEARAQICRGCPRHVKNTDPRTMLEDKAAIAKVHADGRSLSDEESLFNCHVCTCPIASAAHFDVEQSVVGYDGEMWESTPDECWKKIELQGLLPDSPEAIAAKKALRACTTCKGKR